MHSKYNFQLSLYFLTVLIMLSPVYSDAPSDSEQSIITIKNVYKLIYKNQSNKLDACQPCENLLKFLNKNSNTIDSLHSQISSLNNEIIDLQGKHIKYKNLKRKENQDYIDQISILNKRKTNLEKEKDRLYDEQIDLEHQLLACIYTECFVDTSAYSWVDEYDEYSGESSELRASSTIDLRLLLVSTSCAECKSMVKATNDWILQYYRDHVNTLPMELREGKTKKEQIVLWELRKRAFVDEVIKKKKELKECEKQCIKKDKSHGSLLPDKKKIRYYAAAGVSHVKSEDLRESINAGREIFAANGIDGDFNSDTHDLGHRIILGFEVPLENGSIVDVSVFIQDGITIRGDVSGTAATIGGPFTFDSTGKQEIKTYGIDFSFLYRLTPNLFLGGGLGYHLFDIVDESNVITTLNGVITSSVASRDSEHESVVAATAKVRYNLGKRIFLGGDVSRTLEEVGFNDDDHVTSVNAHVGVRF